MAKGIYERKGKNGDVTYYIRYQFKTLNGTGNEIIKDIKKRSGANREALTATGHVKPSKRAKAKSRKAGLIWRKSVSLTRLPNFCSVIIRTLKVTKHRMAARNTRWMDLRIISADAI